MLIEHDPQYLFSQMNDLDNNHQFKIWYLVFPINSRSYHKSIAYED